MTAKNHEKTALLLGIGFAVIVLVFNIRNLESNRSATSTFGIILPSPAPPPPPPPPPPPTPPPPAPAPPPGSGGGGGGFVYSPAPTVEVTGGPAGKPLLHSETDWKLVINSGARKTKNRNILLSIVSGAEAHKMEVSNFPDFKDSKKEDFKRNKKWDLCSKSGGKIKIKSCRYGRYGVYVRLYDKKGNVIADLSRKIIYEGRKKPAPRH